MHATATSRFSLLPASATADARRLVTARALRGFADGFVSVMLASYLHGRGFSPFEISAIVTGTLLGSAVLTLAVGLAGYRLSRRRLLFASTALMLATGLGFALATNFWVLLAVAVIGTMNPTAGDVSVFLPTEQSLLSEEAADHDRTSLFARYNLGGLFAAALGSLVVGVPVAVARLEGWPLVEVQRASFLIYALVAAILVLVYARMTPEGTHEAGAAPRPAAPLRQARSVVLRLSALFSLDAFGGGFVVQTLITLWLFQRFDMAVSTAGAIFFVSGLLSALSQLGSPWLARRIGLINTMVYTHLPANAFLILAALMPNATLAVAFLLARMLLSSMDVPARQSYTMAVVPPEERAAAASVTNVPRSLASAFAPLLAGWLLTMGASGGPLIAGGAIKIVYDLLLLWQFRAHPPPEERRPA